jgi:AhpD family alkylhydroperoxidase
MRPLDPYTASPKDMQELISLHAFLDSSGLEESLRELVRMQVSLLNGCTRGVRRHCHRLTKLGETTARLTALVAVPGYGSQVRGWSNCAVLIGFLLGRPYLTWTPHGLYRRLSGESGVRSIDLAQWLAKHVRVVAVRNAIQACPVTPLCPSIFRPSHQERPKGRAHNRLVG